MPLAGGKGVLIVNSVGIFVLIAGGFLTILGAVKRITKTWGTKEGKRDRLLPIGIVAICIGVILTVIF